MRLEYILLMAVILLASCNRYDDAVDRKRLMELHQQARENHFTKNAKAMVEGFAENFLSVNRGKIDSLSTREDHMKRFQGYFDAVEFKKWEDVSEPTIRFSNDHSLAYMTVNKIVVLETKDTVGNAIEETTHFAWISIFRKQTDGDWKLECVASTNQPAIIKPL